MQGTPNFSNTPFNSGGIVVSGSVSRTAPTSGFLVGLAPITASGARVERVSLTAIGPIASGTSAQLFRVSGTTYLLYDEVNIPPSSAPGSGVVPWQYSWNGVSRPDKIPILMDPGWSLAGGLSSTPTSGLVYFAEGGKF